jgi:hypothetical protein
MKLLPFILRAFAVIVCIAAPVLAQAQSDRSISIHHRKDDGFGLDLALRTELYAHDIMLTCFDRLYRRFGNHRTTKVRLIGQGLTQEWSRCRRKFISMRPEYMLALAARTTTGIIIITTVVAGMAADLVGLFRAASVSPIGMVRGTSMEGGRATGDANKHAEAASAAFSFLALCPSS